jgi:hypothetical protein
MASKLSQTPSTSIELDTSSLNDMLRRMQEAPEDNLKIKKKICSPII